MKTCSPKANSQPATHCLLPSERSSRCSAYQRLRHGEEWHEPETALVAPTDSGFNAAARTEGRRCDMLPERLPRWNLVLARDGDEDWAVGLRCPCGCGQRLEMMLLKEVKPRWDFSVDRHGHVSLHPSVCGCARDANPISGCDQARSFGANDSRSGAS